MKAIRFHYTKPAENHLYRERLLNSLYAYTEVTISNLNNLNN